MVVTRTVCQILYPAGQSFQCDQELRINDFQVPLYGRTLLVDKFLTKYVDGL